MVVMTVMVMKMMTVMEMMMMMMTLIVLMITKRMMVVVLVVVATILPSLSSLPSPNTSGLNGYSVPGVVWALVTQQAKTSTAPHGAYTPVEKRVKKKTNKIISGNEKDKRKL